MFARTGAAYDDISGVESTADYQGAEETSGFDCPVSTKVNMENGEITVQECEEDADIEAELVSEISAYAASLETKEYFMETPQSDQECVPGPASEGAAPESSSDSTVSCEGTEQ